MKVIVIPIDANSTLLEQVKNLGQSNASTLGFLPEGAYNAYAADHRILVAVEDGDRSEILGYLIYRPSNRRSVVSIVHLCVRESSRRRGVARALTDELKRSTKERWHAIRVHCRRDYDASKVWPTLGFIAEGEKQGRSKEGSTLTIWSFDHSHPTLFSYAEDSELRSKLKVVLDANVVFKLLEAPDSANQESQALLADWLQEDIDLNLTDEILNEINRCPDPGRRKSSRAFVQRFTILRSEQEAVDKARLDIDPYFDASRSDRDESDIQQIAKTLAAGIQLFVTRDEGLLEKSDQLSSRFGLRIIRPVDLIISQDQLRREMEYAPVRLAGSILRMERVDQGSRREVANEFRAPSSEKAGQFDTRLNACLANPQTNEVWVVKSTKCPLVLFVQGREDDSQLHVPVFRLARHPMAPTVARHLVHQFVLTAARECRTLVKVTDPCLTPAAIDILQEGGFFSADNAWTRISISVIGTAEQVRSRFTSLAVDHPPLRIHLEKAANVVELACKGDASQMLSAERSLWPAKVTDTHLPAYIVPIQPVWAMNLFDSGMANQDLFGGDPTLILNVENVYYRSCRPRI